MHETSEKAADASSSPRVIHSLYPTGPLQQTLLLPGLSILCPPYHLSLNDIQFKSSNMFTCLSPQHEHSASLNSTAQEHASALSRKITNASLNRQFSLSDYVWLGLLGHSRRMEVLQGRSTDRKPEHVTFSALSFLQVQAKKKFQELRMIRETQDNLTMLRLCLDDKDNTIKALQQQVLELQKSAKPARTNQDDHKQDFAAMQMAIQDLGKHLSNVVISNRTEEERRLRQWELDQISHEKELLELCRETCRQREAHWQRELKQQKKLVTQLQDQTKQQESLARRERQQLQDLLYHQREQSGSCQDDCFRHREECFMIQVESLIDQVRVMQCTVADKDATIKDLQCRIKEKSSVYRKELKERDKEIEELYESLDGRWRGVAQALEKEIDALMVENNELLVHSSETKECNDQLRELEKCNTTLDQDKQRLLDKNMSLRNALDLTRHFKSQLAHAHKLTIEKDKRKYQDLTNVLDSIKDENKDLQAALDVVKKQRDHFKSDLHSVKKQKRQLKREIEATKQRQEDTKALSNILTPPSTIKSRNNSQSLMPESPTPAK